MKEFVLKLARQAIETYVKTCKKLPKPKEYPKELDKKAGVFVTVYKNNDLRGCIGLPFPDMPLVDGIIEAAIDVCSDPRFPPLSKNELNEISIEVSILSEPELIKARPIDCKKHIEIGKDGLIIRKGMRGGLFLPQVPVEQHWNKDQYLENLCYKAGLTGDAWLVSDCKLYKFQTRVFSESQKT